MGCGPSVAPLSGSINHSGELVMSDSYSSRTDVEVGQIFMGKKDLKMKLSILSMNINFKYKVKKSSKSLLTVKCIGENCKWSLRALKLPGCDLFKITKYLRSHTCSIGILNHDHRQATTMVVGQIIKDKFTTIGRVYKPHDIVEDMRKEYGMNISYDKAWRARETIYAFARGTPEDSYANLHAYGEALKIENPGIVFEIELEDSIHFKYMFMALRPYIRGFASCWPVIIVDGPHLKGKYKGTLLVDASMDGNNQIYPLVYAIVDNETNHAWKWFMSNLKSAIGEPLNLVFVFDRW